MEKVSRDQIKQLFKKVKHLRLPKDLEQVDFDKLHYYTWRDTSEDVLYMVYRYDGELNGIRWDIQKLPNKLLGVSFCELCQKNRQRNEIILVSAKSRKLAKGVSHRVTGNYICSNSEQCNQDLQNYEGLDKLFKAVVNN